jgi:hypothetical protein
VFVQSKSAYVPAGEVFIELGFRKLVRTSIQWLEESLLYFTRREKYVTVTIKNTHWYIAITATAATATIATVRLAHPHITIDPIWHGADVIVMKIDMDRDMNMDM